MSSDKTGAPTQGSCLESGQRVSSKSAQLNPPPVASRRFPKVCTCPGHSHVTKLTVNALRIVRPRCSHNVFHLDLSRLLVDQDQFSRRAVLHDQDFVSSDWLCGVNLGTGRRVII